MRQNPKDARDAAERTVRGIRRKTLAMVACYAHRSGAHIETAMSRLQGRIGGGNAERISVAGAEKLP